ncbi:HAAS signaling domain-containing protein [Herbiconiux sp. UC225_62]|uniref:HAAS signaling domain-containing protein n=1 Tax=Herbiconiux sp. UC225_62 TaxID=3350168 RepID=UPI0036D34EAF
MTSESRSIPAQRYLGELDAALAAAPASVRTDLLADIAGELDGLNDEEARARIAELGDPRAIAADATAQLRSMNPDQPSSLVYPTVTAVVLTVGWYVGLGWIAGLVLIGVGSGWTSAVRRRAILTSIAGAVVALAALLFFRTTDFGLVGLGVLLILPLLVNIFVGSFLRAHWGERSPA